MLYIVTISAHETKRASIVVDAESSKAAIAFAQDISHERKYRTVFADVVIDHVQAVTDWPPPVAPPTKEPK